MSDGSFLVTLVKHVPQEVEYWPSLLVGVRGCVECVYRVFTEQSASFQGREIDVDLIEGSKYLDRSLLKKVKASKQQAKKDGTAAGGAPGGEANASPAPL